MHGRYKILSVYINGAFVGVMNEKLNSIKTSRINSVKIYVFSQWTAVFRITIHCNEAVEQQ